jgi:two-component system, OmpR family, sensor kinase
MRPLLEPLAHLASPMRRPRSIRVHLSAVFFFFFLLVTVLGWFSITRLRDFNDVSADITDRWLPKTRLLGDLNNFTSDFRAAEGSYLLSGASGTAGIEREMAELDRSIAQAQGSYERMPRDAAEGDLYQQFKDGWSSYRGIVDQVLSLSSANRTPEATAMYMTSSRSAYDAASDVLGQLTNRTVQLASAASGRVAATYQQAYWLIDIAMAIAGVMVAAALLYIRRWISDPLLDLANCMHRLAANNTDIDVTGQERNDEIGEMARAAIVFRNNAIELMHSQRGLAQQASMLEEKLAAERHLTLLQRNFVSMASHEFRTPLTIIDGHAQRLIKTHDRLRPADAAERAGKIRRAVLRMTQLIDTLLNSSRLMDGGAQLYFHPVDIDARTLLHEVCALHREIAPKSQLLEQFGAASLPMIGDPKLLFQAFSNLLSNAIKYSPRGGPITIDTVSEGGTVAVSVEDHGIGIPRNDIDRLFERYFRGSNVSGIVGTGVGLYLVKMVVDLHGGSIVVESTESAGSRFTIRLPVKPAVQTDAPSQLESVAG